MNALSADSITFAEIKAEISGNPLVLEHLQLSKEITKLSVQHKRHQQQQHQYEDGIKRYLSREKAQAKLIHDIKSDMAKYEANALPKGEFEAVVSGYDVDKFATAAELLEAELQHWSKANKTSYK
ncbi:hypothetical protein, partial [Vibrio parahaemolyticus]